MKVLYPDIYSFDQLFTFSGLEGRTDYRNMLTLLSRKERFTYWAMLPERNGTIRIPDYDGPFLSREEYRGSLPKRTALRT